MGYFLGIDAGGTKTVGALGDDYEELARAEAGTIKLLRTSRQAARRNLEELLGGLTRCGVALEDVDRICLGTSGYSVPLVSNWIRETIQLLTPGKLLLCGDEEIALNAAFRNGPGIMVIAGTGSIAVGRTRAGNLVRAGGWGPNLADDGSGYWIGRQALREAFRAQDETRPSSLLMSFLEVWQMGALENLIENANATSAPDFSRLAPIVAECARRGDAVACEVLERAGEELARLAILVVRQFRRLGEQPPWNIAFTGGVLAKIDLVQAAMARALRRENCELGPLFGPVDPVRGALWRARTG